MSLQIVTVLLLPSQSECLFIYFSLVAVARTSDIMLNESAERDIVVLFLILKEKFSVLALLSLRLVMCFS